MTYYLLALWLITGVVDYGGMFAYWQRQYPYSARKSYWQDMAFSVFMSAVPFGFISGLFVSGFYQHGFKFW